MNKTRKKWTRMIASILILAMFFTSCEWPMQVQAADVEQTEEEVTETEVSETETSETEAEELEATESETTEAEETQTMEMEEVVSESEPQELLLGEEEPTDIPVVVAEVESERTEYTKHFRMSDGTFQAAIYAEPVHYLEEGEWKDIDNTLEATTENGKNVYRNARSKHSVTFEEGLEEDGVTLKNDKGYQVSFKPISNESKLRKQKLKGEKKKTEELKSISMKDKDGRKNNKKMKEMAAEGRASGIHYENVYDGADLEYIVTPSSLKENIVIHTVSEEYIYHFQADFGELIPVIEEDGSIGLYKNTEDADPEMYVDAPYMYDAAGEYSEDVELSLTQTADGYQLTVTADVDWINDPQREFPVVVDPTVKLDIAASDIMDTYVSNTDPNIDFPVSDHLYVGYNSLGRTRSYIKYVLPDLPDCSIVTGASLVLQQEDYDSGGTTGTYYVYAYDCANNYWDISNITWNNQPMNKSSLSSYTVLDYQQYRANSQAGYCEPYTFDITMAAKRWYEEGVNNGIMLASSNESVKRRNRFCSCNYSTNSSYFPTVWVSYVNNTGIEDYWTYQTADLGRSGTVYVGDYNGTFTYIHSDMATGGERMPASVSHVYSNDRTYFGGTYGKMKLGIGFRYDILEKVTAISNSGANAPLYKAGYRIHYLDSDGTSHYFKTGSSSDKYVHEFNDKLTITKQSNGQYKMEDDKGNSKLFAGGGYLLQIKDSNENTTTITYSNNQIVSVTDGAGKKITFEYDASNFLTKIKDPSGRAISYTYDQNYLRSITYPDGKKTTFYYANEGARINQIVTFDGSELFTTLKKVSTKTKAFFRVATMHTKDTQAVLSSRLTFSYKEGYTEIRDNEDKVLYITFDSAGRTVNVRDHEDNASYAQYNTSGNKTNTLSVASDAYAAIGNLAKNHSAELTNGGEWYQQTSGTGAAGSATISSQEHYIGSKSFCVKSTSSTGRVNYCQAFTATPGKTYTLSAQVKLSGISGSGGARLGICYKTSSGSWLAVYGTHIAETDGWFRDSITLELPSTATGNIGIMLIMNNASGTAWFDSVQLEEGEAMNRYNLLENGNFHFATNSWSFSNKESSDGTVSGYHGNGLRFYGKPSARKNIYQKVTVNAEAGTTAVFGAWVKANAAGQTNNDSADTEFKITMALDYADGTRAWATKLFHADVNQVQYISGAVELKKACNSITYYLTYYNNVNTAIFDDACLYLDSFGTVYSYNDDGRIKTVKDSTGGILSYTYTGPDITKISNTFDGEEKDSWTYTYDNKHNLLTATTKNGIVTSYTRPDDAYGKATEVTIKNADGSLQSACSYTYTADYDYLITVEDQRDGVTSYEYDTLKGLMTAVTDAKGNRTVYTYDSNTDELLSVSGNADSSTAVSTAYDYTDDRLTEITHNSFNYGFNYDTNGRLSSVTAAGEDLISHSYNSDHTLNTSTYGNGDTVSYGYDSLARVVSESYNGVKNYEYIYDREGLVAKEKDLNLGVTTVYSYDFARRLQAQRESNGFSAFYVYKEDNLSKMKVKKGSETLADDTYTYTDEGLPTETVWAGTGNMQWTYDTLDRSSTEKTILGEESFTTSYSFLSGSGTNTTGYVSGIAHQTTTGSSNALETTGTYNYSYDALGNITEVKRNNSQTDSYVYDNLGQLIRHNDARAARTWVYAYDAGGNLTSKKEYNYTTGTLGSVLSTKNYSYDSDWKDQLISYNGTSISYDEIGNPLTYLGYTMDWEKGRILSSISGNGKNLTFSYNSAGLRAKKISGSTTYNYYYAGDVLVAQHDGTSWMKFLYGADGDVAGFTLNGETYLYVKNIQGDVIGILDDTMSQLCSYHYDAWGKCTVYDASGNKSTSSSFIGNINPIRYRGYYYDVETGFYYVSSRYYDPGVGRFISPDSTDVLDVQSDLYDKNLYAYCDNNPVMRKDETGTVWIALGIGAIAGVLGQYASDVIGNISSGATGRDMFAISSSGRDYFASAIGGAIAATPGLGLAGSAVAGASGNIVTSAIKNQLRTDKDVLVSGAWGATTNAVGAWTAKKLASSKVNRLDNMTRAQRKRIVNRKLYRGSQANINKNYRDYKSDKVGTVERKLFSFKSGFYSTVTSMIAGLFRR